MNIRGRIAPSTVIHPIGLPPYALKKKLMNRQVRVRISYYYAWLVVYIVSHLLMSKIQVTGS